MEKFKLKGDNGYVLIDFQEVFGFPDNTSFSGGYDVRGNVEIKSSNYSAQGELYFSTGEIYNFYSSLKKCYHTLDGKAELVTTESNLSMLVEFQNRGHVVIKGEYVERYDENNKLIFEITSDQSFIQGTVKELNNIIEKFGGLEGIKTFIGGTK